MSELYNNKLARVYDKIYQGFINYQKEYEFYSILCKKHHAASILEIACGSGNLSSSFIENFEKYTGLDYSTAMLKLAKSKCPNGEFIEGDMRSLRLPHNYDAVLITGRSTSYLLNDTHVKQTFSSVYKTLTTNGIFIFDTINAKKFIPYILENTCVTHYSTFNGKNYKRISNWKSKKATAHYLIDWQAEYFKIEQTTSISLGKDNAVFRVFTENEIKASLEYANFKILEILDRKTYAFDTQVFVCIKT